MIGRLIIADQKIAMLQPILNDETIYKKWDKSYGAHGLELLRITLFFDLIRELAAISIDKDSRAPSIKNILKLLDSNALVVTLKSEYCKPLPIKWINDIDEESKIFWEERHKERKLEESKEKFDNHLLTAKESFTKLKKSELFKKIRDSRNKIVAHYEMRSEGSTPSLFSPTDINLKWGDPEDFYEKIKPIITELLLLISNEGYPLDLFKEEHEKVSNDFWTK